MTLDVPIVGTRFTMLTVTGDAPSNKGGRRVSVRCDCGVEKIVHVNKLVKGTTKSCGCRRAEVMRKAATDPDHPRTKHGAHGDRLYHTWQAMKARCSNPNHPSYRWYGAKGVTVCQEWQDFLGFKEWALSSGYSDNLTIDRIDADGDYEPSNCQWVTQSENTLRMLQARKEAT